MKAFRMSMYANASDHPLTIGVLADSLATGAPMSPGEFLAHHMAADPCSFYVVKEYELEDAATLQDFMLGPMKDDMAANAASEHEMAAQFYWHRERLGLARPKGVVAGTTPLSLEDATYVLTALALCAEYDQHVVMLVTHDQEVVTLKAGVVHVGEKIPEPQ